MSGHWEDMYGNEKKGNKDFIEGVIAGLEYCATTNFDGKRVVGLYDESPEKVIAKVKEQLG